MVKKGVDGTAERAQAGLALPAIAMCLAGARLPRAHRGSAIGANRSLAPAHPFEMLNGSLSGRKPAIEPGTYFAGGLSSLGRRHHVLHSLIDVGWAAPFRRAEVTDMGFR